jgi:hypothetical protein
VAAILHASGKKCAAPNTTVETYASQLKLAKRLSALPRKTSRGNYPATTRSEILALAKTLNANNENDVFSARTPVGIAYSRLI